MKMQRGLAALLALALALTAAGCARESAPPAEPEPEKRETEVGTPAPEPYERPEVENNGGSFVRVGEQVWFRFYDEGAIDESQLWGEFLSTLPGHPVSSKLCFYDLEGDAIMEKLADDGFGPLWFGENGFYLSRGVYAGGAQTGAEAYFKALDGTETVLGPGKIAGVSDNGRFAAVQDGNRLTVFEGTAERTDGAAEGDFCACGALTDDGGLIYYACDYDAGEARLMCRGADGRSVRLGLLPALPEGSSAYAWEPEQCLLDGGGVWCAFGAYEGTGHFLADTLLVRAKPDAPDSLTVVEDEAETEYPFVPRLYRDESGAVRRGEFAPGDPALSEGAWGDLIVHDANGGTTVLEEGFLPGVSDEGEGGYIVQAAEAVGGDVFLVVARAYRDPENDIGWRTSYLPGELYYLRAPSGGGVETLYGPQWSGAAPDARQLYENYIGTWVLTATEVEGDYSDELPEGTFEYLEFREDGTAEIGGTEYNNVFSSAQMLPVGSTEAETSDFGLLFTGGENDDMLWTFFEGDALIGTVMIHFDDGGNPDAFSRTGFYERSEG